MYKLVGWSEIDRWWAAVGSQPELQATVGEWLDKFHDGYGFASGEPTEIADLYVARVPSTSIEVTFLVRHALDPPTIVIRRIEPPAP